MVPLDNVQQDQVVMVPAEELKKLQHELKKLSYNVQGNTRAVTAEKTKIKLEEVEGNKEEAKTTPSSAKTNAKRLRLHKKTNLKLLGKGKASECTLKSSCVNVYP